MAEFPCAGWGEQYDWLYSPTDAEEAGDREWVDLANTYDRDCASLGLLRLSYTWPTQDRVTTTWFFGGVEADVVQLKGSWYKSPYKSASYSARVAVDGSWIEIIGFGARYWGGSFSVGFPRGSVTKFEVVLQNYAASDGIWRVYEVAAGIVPPECRGVLQPICEWLHRVGMFFHGLAANLEGVLVIGPYLSAPFDWLGDLFEEGSAVCCQVSATLTDMLQSVEGGLTWQGFLDLIGINAPTLYALITDPVGWFLVQLTLAFDLEPWHTQSLEFLAKWILETYFPTLYRIWLDPPGWFAILLEDRFPILYYLVVDPKGEILYLIGQAFDLTPYEAQSAEFIVKALFERYFLTLYQLWLDPEDWLVEHVDPRVLAVPVAIAAFLDDPWGWLFDLLEDRIDMYADRIGTITLEIIARLLGV